MELKAEISLKYGYQVTLRKIYNYITWLIHDTMLDISGRKAETCLERGWHPDTDHGEGTFLKNL